MQKRARHFIIPFMWVWTERLPGGRLLRWLCVVTAVLAALVAGIAVFDQRANADSYDSEELQFLELINDYRQQNGLGTLLLSDALSVSAEHHDQDMARYSFFAHDTAGSSYYRVGSQPWDRMEEEGYKFNTYKGENIAVGYETAEEAFLAWRRSPSHNQAMLDGKYRVIGIARINDPGSVHGWYWTTDFGGVEDPSSHAPGESPQPADTNEEPHSDGPGVENGEMEDGEIWEQKTDKDADLIVDGHAHLGNFDDGTSDLRQKIQVGEDAELSYDVRIETNEHRHPSDRLLVQLTDQDGKQLAVLERYTDGDAGGWRHETVDLSDFAGRKVYLSFFVEADPVLRTDFYVDKVSLEERP
jgi:uncharacterized protein YkwD